jgi:hypothetical protein
MRRKTPAQHPDRRRTPSGSVAHAEVRATRSFPALHQAQGAQRHLVGAEGPDDPRIHARIAKETSIELDLVDELMPKHLLEKLNDAPEPGNPVDAFDQEAPTQRPRIPLAEALERVMRRRFLT